MITTPRLARDHDNITPSAAPTPDETARYTREMLDSLKNIAVRQEQHVLAGLLEAAAREAKRLIANSF